MMIIVEVPRHLTLDDVDVGGKTVLVRCDLNVPIDKKSKEISGTFKIEVHKETLAELIERGARVVILSHQSRLGKDDCISLKAHAKVLSDVLKQEVKFVDSVYTKRALDAVKNLNDGEVLLLENLRFYDDENKKGEPEERATCDLVKNLSSVADIYVCDAFACTHRKNASMVGFPHVMPSVVARLMERELRVVEQVNGNPRPPMGYVLGGAKLEDTFLMIENALEKDLADYLIVTGVPSLAFLKASGIDIGSANEAFLEKNGYGESYKHAEELLKAANGQIYLPIDVAIDKNGKREELAVDDLPTDYPILDIGQKSIEEFTQLIHSMKTVFCNGPAGVFENPEFSKGTIALFKAMADSSAYSVIGGGDTSAAIRKLGIDGFNHVSSGGGALLHLLAGKNSTSLTEILTQRVPLPSRTVKL